MAHLNVGQTDRQLKKRIKEHMKIPRNVNTRPTVMPEHRLWLNHEFDWDNPTILHEEHFYHKRIIAEML